MPRPLLLDGCCGAGGSARGYAEAGFEVWGADSNPRLERDYLASGATRFFCADILEILADRVFLRQFDFIHVSFPCQHYSQMSRCRPGLAAGYPELISPGRPLLTASGKPFVIENVGAARPWLRDPACLCGIMFGRKAYRHRLFEPGGGLRLVSPAPGHQDSSQRRKPNKECGWVHPVAAAKAGHWKPGMFVSVSGHERKEPVREAMAINWMRNREDVKEAIPPYFTEFLGRQVLMQLES
jgi:DNA (cytosine-5)-methyltransferase 1